MTLPKPHNDPETGILSPLLPARTLLKVTGKKEAELGSDSRAGPSGHTAPHCTLPCSPPTPLVRTAETLALVTASSLGREVRVGTGTGSWGWAQHLKRWRKEWVRQGVNSPQVQEGSPWLILKRRRKDIWLPGAVWRASRTDWERRLRGQGEDSTVPGRSIQAHGWVHRDPTKQPALLAPGLGGL